VPSEHRISFSVSAEMREKISRIASLMGLTEAGAARYLVSRGLEGLIGMLSTSQTADTLKSMFEMFEREAQKEEVRRAEKGKKQDRVLVTPDLRQKNLSVRGKGERKEASLFDVHEVGKKGGKGSVK
jgi:predicted transcriptional regulator